MKKEIIHILKEKLVNDILKQPGLDIKEDEPLISSGLIDSFSLVDVSLFVEDTFNVLIDDTELTSDTFDTLDELADLILSRQE